MSRMSYAGIGARATPIDVCRHMRNIAINLEATGFVLRSGHADGADKAFESGVTEEDNMEIYLPWKGFNGSKSSRYTICPRAFELAERYHPAWNKCGPYAKKLIARNGYQLLGQTLENPSKFAICWTPGGRTIGGTGQGIRIAEAYEIPVINMGASDWEDKFDEVMRELGVYA